jgi:dephospho-CoA kinase
MSEPAKNGPKPRPVLIGITGPIGCGKSTVSRLLGELGGAVIDADFLAREATAAGSPTLSEIRARFGDVVFQADGQLDRAKMAAVVFHDAAALADLERIVHPEVRKLLDRELAMAADDEVPFVVVEAIKLVEGGLADRCDEVWLVECDPQTQRQRLLARGESPQDADRRVEAQGTDLVGRLEAELRSRESGSPNVRRMSTTGTIEETRERMEDALADAFEAANRT